MPGPSDAGTVPTSVEEAIEASDRLLPSPVIPGSQIQETTALRGIPRPAFRQSTLSRITDAMQVIGAGFGDIERKAGAGQKTIDFLTKIRDDRNSKAALGYLIRLQALAVQDPTKAQDALADLNDFILQNAEKIPVETQAVASKLVENLKGIIMQQGTREALQAFSASPTLDVRMKEFARLMQGNPNMDPKLALAMVQAIPDPAIRWEYREVKGVLFKLDRLGQFPPEKVGGAPTADIKIPEAARNAYDLSWKEGMPTTSELEASYQQGDPKAQAAVALAQKKAQAMAEAKTEFQQRPKIAEKNLEILGRHLPQERMAQLQYVKDLQSHEYKILQDELQREYAMKNISSALITRTVTAVDAQGNTVQYDPMQVDQVSKLVANKQAFLVNKAQLDRIGAVKKNMGDLVLVEKLAARVLQGHEYRPGTNLLNALTQYSGSLLGASDVALFRGITGKMGMEMAVAIQGSRPSEYEDKAAQRVVPQLTDSMEQTQKKLRYLLWRSHQVIGIETGAIKVTDDSLASSVAEFFPEYTGVIKGIESAPSAGTAAGFPGTKGTGARKVRKLW